MAAGRIVVPSPLPGFGLTFGFTTFFLSAIILGVGFLMIGWTQRKQGLHDMVAGTLVHKSRTPADLRSSATVFE